MLSLFPQILFLAPFGALVVRVAAGVAFAYMAYEHAHAPEVFPRIATVLEALCAALLIAGIYTQAGALLGIAIFLAHAAWRPLRALPLSASLLLLALCSSILVTGAGALAFDLPL